MAEKLIPFESGVQYNGSNGAAILAEIPAQIISDANVYIISEANGVMVLGYDDAGPNSATYQTGDWVTWGYSFPKKATDAYVNSAYVKRSDLA